MERTVIGNNAAPLRLALNENWSGFSCAETNIDDGVFATFERWCSLVTGRNIFRLILQMMNEIYYIFGWFVGVGSSTRKGFTSFNLYVFYHQK